MYTCICVHICTYDKSCLRVARGSSKRTARLAVIVIGIHLMVVISARGYRAWTCSIPSMVPPPVYIRIHSYLLIRISYTKKAVPGLKFFRLPRATPFQPRFIQIFLFPKTRAQPTTRAQYEYHYSFLLFDTHTLHSTHISAHISAHISGFICDIHYTLYTCR